jgi:hypothetical protein
LAIVGRSLFIWNNKYFDQPLPQLAIDWESSSANSHSFSNARRLTEGTPIFDEVARRAIPRLSPLPPSLSVQVLTRAVRTCGAANLYTTIVEFFAVATFFYSLNIPAFIASNDVSYCPALI